MPRSRSFSTVPAAMRRQLDVAAAVARERVKEVHVRYALELVEHAAREMEPRRSLDIYARLHKLGVAEAQGVIHEVFMALGRRSPPQLADAAPAPREDPPGAPGSILGQIRRRIRGRVNAELREWVEHHTGRAETALLWTHVENAHEFVDLLQGVRSPAEAVTLYAELMGVAPPRSEIVYYLVLDRRSTPGSAGGSQPFADRRRRPLKIVEKRRVRGQHRTR